MMRPARMKVHAYRRVRRIGGERIGGREEDRREGRRGEDRREGRRGARIGARGGGDKRRSEKGDEEGKCAIPYQGCI